MLICFFIFCCLLSVTASFYYIYKKQECLSEKINILKNECISLKEKMQTKKMQTKKIKRKK